jgi:hypothetical protein
MLDGKASAPGAEAGVTLVFGRDAVEAAAATCVTAASCARTTATVGALGAGGWTAGGALVGVGTATAAAARGAALGTLATALGAEGVAVGATEGRAAFSLPAGGIDCRAAQAAGGVPESPSAVSGADASGPVAAGVREFCWISGAPFPFHCAAAGSILVCVASRPAVGMVCRLDAVAGGRIQCWVAVASGAESPAAATQPPSAKAATMTPRRAQNTRARRDCRSATRPPSGPDSVTASRPKAAKQSSRSSASFPQLHPAGPIASDAETYVSLIHAS